METNNKQNAFFILSFAGYLLAFGYHYLLGAKQILSWSELVFQLVMALLFALAVHLFVERNICNLNDMHRRRILTGIVCIAIIFAFYNPIALPDLGQIQIGFISRFSAFVVVLLVCLGLAKKRPGIRRLMVFLLPGLLQCVLMQYESVRTIYEKIPNLSIYLGAILAFVYWLIDFRKNYDESTNTIRTTKSQEQ